MVAIGLLDIPPEIQLQVAEFVATGQALKALSVTSRSLRCVAQTVLFKTFRVNLDNELTGSTDDLLANPRICAAIRQLCLRGSHFTSTTSPHNHEEKLSLVEKLLPAMIGLRAVRIYQVRLSRAFMDAFLEVAANIRLKVSLSRNKYPPGTNPTLHTSLRIYRLRLIAFPNVSDHASHDFFRSVLRASATTLTELITDIHEDQLMGLDDINLPYLHDLTLWVPNNNEVSRTSATAFVIAQRTIRKLELRGESGPLPAIPPDALPNLRRLSASTELINQLVPGRPVEAIDVRRKGRNWFGEEVARSTAGVRKLRVRFNIGMLDLIMLERAVAILPSLESLWLPVFDDVCGPFVRLP